MENLKKVTMEQIIQAELMLEFFKNKKVDKEKKAAQEVRITEHTTKKESNEEFLDFLNTL